MTHTRFGFTVVHYALLLVVPAALPACGEPEIQYQPSAVFVGRTAPSGAAVAVVLGTSSSQATVYVCDGVSASAWFNGTSSGNAVTATTDDGAKAALTIAGDRATGTVEVAGQGSVNFTAERASGVAGIYLVEQSSGKARGFSARGGQLEATLAGTGASVTASGTVTPRDGTALPLGGTVLSFGESTGVATWIVQANGEVNGRTTSNTAGGGNCSIWSKIKSVMFGVDCTFF